MRPTVRSSMAGVLVTAVLGWALLVLITSTDSQAGDTSMTKSGASHPDAGWTTFELIPGGAVEQRVQLVDTSSVIELRSYQTFVTQSDMLTGLVEIPDKCPCCPPAYGPMSMSEPNSIKEPCCRPCHPWTSLKIDKGLVTLELVDSLSGLIEIRTEHHHSGKAVVEGFAEIEISGDGTGSRTLDIGIAMVTSDTTIDVRQSGLSTITLDWTPDSATQTQVVRLRREFQVGAGAATFHLLANAGAGPGAKKARARGLNVTFFPDLN